MARHKSAVKKHKQSLVRRLRNKMKRSMTRTLAKKVIELVEKKDAGAKEALSAAQSALFRTAKVGAISKNAAARKTSRLAKKLNAAS